MKLLGFIYLISLKFQPKSIEKVVWENQLNGSIKPLSNGCKDSKRKAITLWHSVVKNGFYLAGNVAIPVGSMNYHKQHSKEHIK